MVEEGGNPILEGSIAMVANLQDMLLQDFANVIPHGQHPPGASAGPTSSSSSSSSSSSRSSSSSGAAAATERPPVFIAIFPAVPAAWEQAAFHHLRTLGAFLVSAKREGGRTVWVQLVSNAGLPVVVAAEFSESFGPIVLISSSETAKLIPLYSSSSSSAQTHQGDGGAGGAGGHLGEGETVDHDAAGTRQRGTTPTKQWRVDGLKAGEVALLQPRDFTQSRTITPLPPVAAEVNYYGFRRAEW